MASDEVVPETLLLLQGELSVGSVGIPCGPKETGKSATFPQAHAFPDHVTNTDICRAHPLHQSVIGTDPSSFHRHRP